MLCIAFPLTGYFILKRDGISPCVPAWADPIPAAGFLAQYAPAPKSYSQEMGLPPYFRVGSGAGYPRDNRFAPTVDPNSASAVAGEFTAAFVAIRSLRSQDPKRPWGTLRNASASTALLPSFVPLRFPLVEFAPTLNPTKERSKYRLRKSVNSGTLIQNPPRHQWKHFHRCQGGVYGGEQLNKPLQVPPQLSMHVY